jgi:hypothetical protein
VAENREYAKSGWSRARLPIWQELLLKMRDELWEGIPFERAENLDKKMTYIAAMFAFDVAGAGEATATGGVIEVHTILAEEVIIHLERPVLHQ